MLPVVTASLGSLQKRAGLAKLAHVENEIIVSHVMWAWQHHQTQCVGKHHCVLLHLNIQPALNAIRHEVEMVSCNGRKKSNDFKVGGYIKTLTRMLLETLPHMDQRLYVKSFYQWMFALGQLHFTSNSDPEAFMHLYQHWE
ncbi:hypothetical protein DUNSADRAFT_9662 [Dunaliella salina]|uniref:Uncharacterized protein n=1 Tax=Dunaliella salina TaxID=3046 RepID=A0ABQ7FSH6_DUNSA|nr:hypothetical protein DUNSADRAFT_9662 [Dunaliella salina]|eukprot:KAF5825465.1 hypothetical protein DUNSADRAFT_9662 [Dunaliella salina]